LTSLFGGNDEAARLPVTGAVEPLLEKAMEPFKYDTVGDIGLGLLALLDEFEMPDRRVNHEARREATRLAGSASAML
jgi:hypothetical protein